MIFTIKITGEALAVLGEALDLLPHGKAAPIVRAIQAQINETERMARAESEAAAKAGVDKLSDIATTPKKASRKGK